MSRRKKKKTSRKRRKPVFTNNDFNSGQGMLTTVWGPALWHVLHVISFNYPVKPTKTEKREYKRFFSSLEKILPCVYCRQNFPVNCTKAGYCEDVFKNRRTFSRFIYKLHCEVNKKLGKNSGKSCDTYEQVRKRYEHFRARCQKPRKTSRKPKKESGCVDAKHGRLFRCVVDVVPNSSVRKSFRLCSRHT